MYQFYSFAKSCDDRSSLRILILIVLQLYQAPLIHPSGAHTEAAKMAVPPLDMLMYLKLVLPADEHENTWCDETAFAILCIEQSWISPKVACVRKKRVYRRASSHRLMQMSQVRGTYDVDATPFGFCVSRSDSWLVACSLGVPARRRRRNAEASASAHRRATTTHPPSANSASVSSCCAKCVAVGFLGAARSGIVCPTHTDTDTHTHKTGRWWVKGRSGGRRETDIESRSSKLLPNAIPWVWVPCSNHVR